jgi:hypothetical protein
LWPDQTNGRPQGATRQPRPSTASFFGSADRGRLKIAPLTPHPPLSSRDNLSAPTWLRVHGASTVRCKRAPGSLRGPTAADRGAGPHSTCRVPGRRGDRQTEPIPNLEQDRADGKSTRAGPDNGVIDRLQTRATDRDIAVAFEMLCG